jgi:hypothetical protein
VTIWYWEKSEQHQLKKKSVQREEIMEEVIITTPSPHLQSAYQFGMHKVFG